MCLTYILIGYVNTKQGVKIRFNILHYVFFLIDNINNIAIYILKNFVLTFSYDIWSVPPLWLYIVNMQKLR